MSATWDWLTRLLFGPASTTAGGGVAPTGIVSPWQDSSTLAYVGYSELFTPAADIVDRNVAMSVAPIKRGRAIIVGSIADLPLVALNDGTPIKRQPRWLTKTGTLSTPWHRIADTLDDLIFHGWSLWTVQRGMDGGILDALHIPHSAWAFDAQTPLGIRVNDKAVTDASSVVLFQGPDEGVLRTGADVIRGARAMEKAWVGRVISPIPMTVLHETERNGLLQGEAEAYVAAWANARRSPDGAVGFLPSTLSMETYGETSADLFTEGRNNVRLDVANLLNLPASVLDGSTATASLTYSTAQGEFSQLNEWLSYWISPIEARLSMNDVSPNGQTIRFDRGQLSDATPEPFGGPIIPGAIDAPLPAPLEVAQ